MMIGCYELLRHQEIPYRVVINEAVELAKSFGGTDGYKYVNGVLDRLASTIQARAEAGAAHRLPSTGPRGRSQGRQAWASST